VAALVALALANSPLSDSYERLWSTTVSVRIGGWGISEDLRHWVNDVLMTFFFLLVGLEIKREVVSGELADRRAAALPAVAAIGGMVVPAVIYLAFNTRGDDARGWGIPMATDVAFAVGALALIGRGLPGSLRVFLLALAIVDDIGAIVVIAIFYSGAITWWPLLVALALIAAMMLMRRLEVQWMGVYLAMGVGVWFGTYESGVHPTIAGVALGLLAPATSFQRPRAVSQEAHRIADETTDTPIPPDVDAPQWLYLARLSRDAVSHLARLEHLLHPWTSYVIVPLFALANAGVTWSAAGGDALISPVSLGVIGGLVVGKPLGIAVAAWVATKAGLARLPTGVRWSEFVGVGALAGIGFTVSLFIAGLAFQSSENQEAARVGILTASAAAGLLGAAILRGARRRHRGHPPIHADR
jgi:NhaA family Na+:H+ antiporter